MIEPRSAEEIRDTLLREAAEGEARHHVIESEKRCAADIIEAMIALHADTDTRKIEKL